MKEHVKQSSRDAVRRIARDVTVEVTTFDDSNLDEYREPTESTTDYSGVPARKSTSGGGGGASRGRSQGRTTVDYDVSFSIPDDEAAATALVGVGDDDGNPPSTVTDAGVEYRVVTVEDLDTGLVHVRAVVA